MPPVQHVEALDSYLKEGSKLVFYLSYRDRQGSLSRWSIKVTEIGV